MEHFFHTVFCSFFNVGRQWELLSHSDFLICISANYYSMYLPVEAFNRNAPNILPLDAYLRRQLLLPLFARNISEEIVRL